MINTLYYMIFHSFISLFFALLNSSINFIVSVLSSFSWICYISFLFLLLFLFLTFPFFYLIHYFIHFLIKIKKRVPYQREPFLLLNNMNNAIISSGWLDCITKFNGITNISILDSSWIFKTCCSNCWCPKHYAMHIAF